MPWYFLVSYSDKSLNSWCIVLMLCAIVYHLSHNSYEMVSNKPSSYQVILNKVHPDLFLRIFDHFKQQYNLRTKLR